MQFKNMNKPQSNGQDIRNQCDVIKVETKCDCGNTLVVTVWRYDLFRMFQCKCGQWWAYTEEERRLFKTSPPPKSKLKEGDTDQVHEFLMGLLPKLKIVAQSGSFQTFYLLMSARDLILVAANSGTWPDGTMEKVNEA